MPHILFDQFKHYIDANKVSINKLLASHPEPMQSGIPESIFFENFPFLIIDVFPLIRENELQTFTLAGKLFCRSILVCDELIDHGATALQARNSILPMLTMQTEAYRLCYEIFPPQSKFWQSFNQCVSEYINAQIQEQSFLTATRPLSEYTEAVACQIATGKHSLVKMWITGLAELAQNDYIAEILTLAIDNYTFAFQLFDDFYDWKDDLSCGIPSLLLSRVVSEWPMSNDQSYLKSQHEKLARKIYYGGHAHYVLHLALEHLEVADRLTVDFPHLLFRQQMIFWLRHKCQSILKELDQSVRCNVQALSKKTGIALSFPLKTELLGI